jgi:hypothetical protein
VGAQMALMQFSLRRIFIEWFMNYIIDDLRVCGCLKLLKDKIWDVISNKEVLAVNQAYAGTVFNIVTCIHVKF